MSILNLNTNLLAQSKEFIASYVSACNPLAFLPLRSVRNYCNSLSNKGDGNSPNTTSLRLSGPELLEWLRGFIDAEGCFIIKKTQFGFQFEFIIELHIDDLKVLKFLQTQFNMGKVYEYSSKAAWKIFRQGDVKALIALLSANLLSTTKRLDFEDWKLAFELYVNRSSGGSDNSEGIAAVLSNITDIKSRMNKGRSSEVSNLDNIVITEYWLLGFIEGEGNFHVESKSLALKFRLGQVSRDRVLFEKIVLFLNDLAHNSAGKFSSAIHLYEFSVNKDKPNAKPFISIEVSRSEYLLHVLVPFLQNLHWLTKKEFDFIDWTSMLMLVSEGKHLMPEGRDLIKRIISQMNNSRLSTNCSPDVHNREDLVDAVNKLLSAPSNYQVTADGKRVDIYSGNLMQSSKRKGVLLINKVGDTAMTFESGNHCAQYLGIGRTSVYSKIKTNRPFLFEGKTYYIKSLED